MLKKVLVIAVLIAVLICGTAQAQQLSDETEINKILEELGIRDSVSIILVDLFNDEIIFEHKSDVRLKTASTIKLLSCVVALENCSTDEVVTISRAAAGTGGSTLDLKRGEELFLYDLLSGMMVTSGNDAAHAVAEHVAGSQREFAVLLNETAKRIGMTESNFTNSIGTSHSNHYSTAYDMSLLAEYALENETITEMTSRATYLMPQTNLQEPREVLTTDMLLCEESEFYYEYATGLKTGTSRKAKGHFVASAKKDGVALVCVIMNDRSSHYEDRWRIAKALFEYGFSKYDVINVKELLEGHSQITLEVDNANTSLVCGVSEIENGEMTLYKQDAEEVLKSGVQTIVNTGEITLPVLKGDSFGEVIFYNEVSGVELFSGKFVAKNSVYEQKPLYDNRVLVTPKPAPIEPIPETRDFFRRINWLQTTVFVVITIVLFFIFSLIFYKKEECD